MLCVAPAGRRGGTIALAGSGCRTAPVWPSTPSYPARPGGDGDEPQEAVPAISGRRTVGPQAWVPETGVGHTFADDADRSVKPALEPGLSVGCAQQRTALPRIDGGGRLHARMPSAGGGHLVVKRTVQS